MSLTENSYYKEQNSIDRTIYGSGKIRENRKIC